ncbi:MAG TPA: enoyl-CoA hydratase-related protein [Elusimicrobiota bacterium]|jgi:2-(1,2-epoxy-1,2-dihydrophenyl)acetyl-CoA isomerase|nr:enoyl-CoA hydratase-related protein [Elusimicrobiota bacterium]
MMTETAAAQDLLQSTKDGVLSLTLNRPQVLNALTHPMLETLMASLKKAEKDAAVRVVVLSAAGRAFCAGADLGDLKKGYEAGNAPSLGTELRGWFNPLIAQIRSMEKPVVCAVNGIAAGAGASLALACDIKICGEKAKFMLAFVQVGLAPDSGISHSIVRTMGLSKALEHAWTARGIHADQALACGLVNQVVPAEELEKATHRQVEALLKAPPRAVALTKRLLNRAQSTTFEEQMEYEAQIQEVLGKTKDHLEGVTAFLEGRPPAFKGE